MESHPILVYAIFDLSTTHLIIILVILLLLFGAKLPSIMRNLGGSVREFKKGMEENPASNPPPPPPPPAAPAAPPQPDALYDERARHPAPPAPKDAPVARQDQPPPPKA